MPTPIDILTTLRSKNDADSAVLLQIAELGADLEKPVRVSTSLINAT